MLLYIVVSLDLTLIKSRMSKRPNRGNSRGHPNNRGNNPRDVYSRGNPRDVYHDQGGSKQARGGNEPEVRCETSSSPEFEITVDNIFDFIWFRSCTHVDMLKSSLYSAGFLLPGAVTSPA
jgi:hypothetical protein